MALNRAFKVKDDINVLGRILSAGTDLFDIFSDQTASFKVSAENATFFVSGGDAFSIYGDHNSGILVKADVDTETLIVSGKNASYSEKGVSKFSSTNFTVTDGSVSIASQGVKNSNLDPIAVDKDVINPADIVYNQGAIAFSSTVGFSANVDDSTLEIATNKLQIKDDGVTKSKIADNSIDKELIDASDIVYNAGAIAFSNSVGFSANVDNSSIEIGSNNLQVKAGGITNAMLVNDSISFGDGTSSGATPLGGTFEIKGTANQITATFNDLTNDNVTLSIPNNFVVPGELHVTGTSHVQNLSVTGNLLVAGSATFVNTVFTTTSAISVINTGPGPALYVFQSSGLGDVASFYDGDGVEVLHIGNAEPGGDGRGNVGINISEPNVELTVNGSISANNIIYTLNWGDSRDWWSVYTTVQGASASWSGGGGGSVYLGGLSAKWDDNWNTTNTLSASWSAVYANTFHQSAKWDSTYSNVYHQSAKWDSTYANVYHQSAGWIGGNSAYTTVNSYSGNWQDTHAYVLAQSAKWDSVYANTYHQSAKWDSTYSNVYHQSASWIGGNSAYTTVNSESAKWNDTYTYVYSNSANYLLKDTAIQVTSVTLNDTGKTSLRKIYTGSATGTDFFSVVTFPKASYNSAKFIVTVKNVTDNYRTTFEVMAVKTNGTGTWDGTVYAIVDQNNMFRQIDVDTSGSTVDLQITMYAVKNYVVNVLADTLSD